MASKGSPRRAQVDTFFTCQHPERFRIDWRGFYQRAEVRTDEVRSHWEHELDLSYGPSERHRMDLYLPIARNGAAATQSAQWPILLFLHGGGFREGDPALYGYLAEPFLARGIGFASVGYRLTPESYLPETFDDVENALAWCVTNLPSRGIDVDQMALAGHSAGAILTAHLAVRDDWLAQRSLPRDLLKAAIPISGNYDFTNTAYHGEFFTSDSDRSAASPLLRLGATPPPMLVAYGSDENQPAFARDSKRLVDAIGARGGRAELLELEGMTHADTADALGDSSSLLFQSVIALVVSASRPQPRAR